MVLILTALIVRLALPVLRMTQIVLSVREKKGIRKRKGNRKSLLLKQLGKERKGKKVGVVRLGKVKIWNQIIQRIGKEDRVRGRI